MSGHSLENIYYIFNDWRRAARIVQIEMAKNILRLCLTLDGFSRANIPNIYTAHCEFVSRLSTDAHHHLGVSYGFYGINFGLICCFMESVH